MKILLTILSVFFLSNTTLAVNYSGGQIWYEYAGTAQHPHRYDVYALIYVSSPGPAMCPTDCPIDICITSSCFSPLSIQANLLPFTLNPGSDTLYGSYSGSILTPRAIECASYNSFNFLVTETYRFHTQVDLPGTCSDFFFTHASSTRDSSTNLASQDSLYLTSFLNNTIAPNSSPVFVSPASKNFPAFTPATLVQSAIDPDGDSLYFDFGTPFSGTACGVNAPITYANGYSAASPITSLSGITKNHSKGIFEFTPSQVEIDAVNISVKEFRFDAPTNSWTHIGTINRDLQVSIVDSSYKSMQAIWKGWFSYPIHALSCEDTTSIIYLEEYILASSIATDGSDFSLVDSSGKVINISKVSYPDSLVEVKMLTVHLGQPVGKNNFYQLTVQKGSDQNTMVTACSQSIPIGDSIILYTGDCDTTVSLQEIRPTSFSIYPNPADEFLHISHSENAGEVYCEIMDFSGKSVEKQKIKFPANRLNIQHLPQGVYLLKITSQQSSQVIRFEKCFK